MSTDTKHLNPHAPTHYCICAQGVFDQCWLEMLSGVWVLEERVDSGAHMTTLIGCVADQAALLGVLNHLCDLGMPLLSVEWLVNPDRNKETDMRSR